MISRRPIFTSVVLALLASAAATAGELPVTMKVLHNGCVVAVVENHQAPVVALRLYFTHTGSLYERDLLGSGISHYCARVVEGGSTSARTEEETAQLRQSIGGATDVVTQPDLTCFYGETHVAYFDLMLELFADWAQNSSLTPREVESEREIIKREMLKNEDEPDHVAYQLLMETMFRVHPARHPTTGYLDNFLRIAPEDIGRFYQLRYAPNNAVVVVAGDVEPEETIDKLESAFILWERRLDLDLASNLPPEPRQMGRRFAEAEMDVQEAAVRVGFHTIELSDPDLYALDVLAAVFGNGRTSRLHRRLVEREHFTDSVQLGSYTPHYGAGVFLISTQCACEKVPALEKAILEEIGRLAAVVPTVEELDRAKALIERDFAMSQLRAADQAEMVARDLIATGDPNYSARYLQRIRGVSGEQVQAMARKYFAEENETIVVVKPRGEPAVLARPKEAAAPAASGAVRKVVLDDGFTVLLQRNAASPTVGVQAFFRAGVLWETDENAGISNLMARLMLRGTATRTAARISEELESAGAQMASVSGNNTFGLSMLLLPRDLERGLDLFADVLRNATFPEDQVEQEKRISQMLIRREAGSWETEAMRNFREAMFTAHPYRRDPLGTIESVERLDRAAIVQHHATYCTPQNGVLAVFGDIDLDAAERIVRTAFGSWKRGAPVASEVPLEPELRESRVVTYPTSKGQVVICLGFPGATLDSEDRWVLQVIDAAMSGLGAPSGRLPEALRGDRNLVYYVHAQNWNGFGTGALYVLCPCLPDYYDEVIGIIRLEMARLATEGLTPEELESAKRMCVTIDQVSRQSNLERAQAAALDELYGFGWDAWRKVADSIDRITNEDVKRVAARHFDHSVLALTAPEWWLRVHGMLEKK